MQKRDLIRVSNFQVVKIIFKILITESKLKFGILFCSRNNYVIRMKFMQSRKTSFKAQENIQQTVCS